MENVQPWQVLIPFGIAAIIGILCLIWGDRPELAAAIRKRFEPRPRNVMSSLSMVREGGIVEGSGIDYAATTTPQKEQQSIAIDNNERNALLFAGRADALAALVHAGRVGETEGIKIVYGVGPSSSNKTYLTARELLKARLARMQPEKFKLTPEQEAARASLGLSNGKNA